MGADLVSDTRSTIDGASGRDVQQIGEAVPWLDEQSAALARDIIRSVACRHPDLRAVILYGSVARHEERPVSDPYPSDVDLLLLFDAESEARRLPSDLHLAINHSIGLAERLRLHAPREIQTLPAVWNLVDWDPTFIENVARDGILLWACGPLPPGLEAVASRMPNSFHDRQIVTHQ